MFLLSVADAFRNNPFENRTINVAVSEQKPFVSFYGNGIPMGLDVLIIENFAKKFKFHVEYSIINSTLDLLLNGQFSNTLPNDAILR